MYYLLTYTFHMSLAKSESSHGSIGFRWKDTNHNVDR